MVQILPYVPGFGEKLADAFSNAAGQLGQGYFEGRQKKNDLQTIEELSQGNLSPMQQFNAFARLSQDRQKALTPAFTTLLQGQHQAQQNELNRQSQLQAAQIRAAAKGQQLNPFEKTLQSKGADEYVKLQTEIPKLKDTLKNVDVLREQSKNFRGPKGYLKGYIGAGGAADFDATGLLMIEPLLKVFNPVGAIPIAKIKIIQEKSSPKATDPQWVIDGKLNAIERNAQDALRRAERREQVLAEYGGLPPREVTRQLDAEDNAAADAYEEELNALEGIEKKVGQKQQTVEELPPKGSFKGQTATDNDTGQVYVWDGSHWNKK